MNEDPKFDGSELGAHFVVGAILGAILGCASWAVFADGNSWFVGLLLIGGGAISVGLIAGAFTERFWEVFKEWLSAFWWQSPSEFFCNRPFVPPDVNVAPDAGNGTGRCRR